MKKCRQCGAEMNDNIVFCTKCGTKMEQPEMNMGAAQQNQDVYGQNDANSQQNTYQQGPNLYADQQNTYQQGSNPYAGQQNTYQQGPNPYAGQQNAYQQYQPPYDPYDHTAEFDPKDISDNKVIAMLIYLMGVVGIIIALLASNSSKYVAFHVRQGLKFEVVSILVGFVTVLLCWTFIVPIVAALLLLALWVCKIIAFVSICKGRACEPYIVRNLNFLR